MHADVRIQVVFAALAELGLRGVRISEFDLCQCKLERFTVSRGGGGGGREGGGCSAGPSPNKATSTCCNHPPPVPIEPLAQHPLRCCERALNNILSTVRTPQASTDMCLWSLLGIEPCAGCVRIDRQLQQHPTMIAGIPLFSSVMLSLVLPLYQSVQESSVLDERLPHTLNESFPSLLCRFLRSLHDHLHSTSRNCARSRLPQWTPHQQTHISRHTSEQHEGGTHAWHLHKEPSRREGVYSRCTHLIMDLKQHGPAKFLENRVEVDADHCGCHNVCCGSLDGCVDSST